MRSHGSEAAELGLQRCIWANIPHGERDCQGLGQMLASDVTSGGCPPCRTLPRRDTLVNAFSLLHSGKGTPDMQSLWRGYVHLTPLLGWLPAYPLPQTPPPHPSTSPAGSRSPVCQGELPASAAVGNTSCDLDIVKRPAGLYSRVCPAPGTGSTPRALWVSSHRPVCSWRFCRDRCHSGL